MTDETYSDNLLRLLTAQVTLLVGMTAAQQMFGRGYFALSQTEKAAVDQTVLGMVLGNYQALTPEFLAGPKPPQQAGFWIPSRRTHEGNIIVFSPLKGRSWLQSGSPTTSPPVRFL